MVERACPGLPADWLNGWLAAIGATVLVDGLKLRWTDDPAPIAVFSVPEGVELTEAIAKALPTIEELKSSPIARTFPECQEIGINLTFDQFSERAAIARTHPMGWSLSSFYTDAYLEKGKPKPDKGPFLPGMPRGVSLYDRLVELAKSADQASVAASLDGVGARDQQAGLGLDLSRIGSMADDTDQWIDPAMELMAFVGLSLFATRGDGQRTNQRGWRGPRTKPGSFSWPAWQLALDAAAIDALLDVYWSDGGAVERLDLVGAWESMPYRGVGEKDATRGFGARRVPYGP